MSDTVVATARERIDSIAKFLERSHGTVRIIETHISWVLLTDDKAFKFRKPVSLPFVDFSSLAARRHDCDEELRLNRRLASALYLGLTEMTRGPNGLELDGPGEVLDVAVCMKRFPDEVLWSDLIRSNTLTTDHVTKLASSVSQFHDNAPAAAPGSEFGDFAAIDKVTRDLVRNIEALDLYCAPQGVGAIWPAVRDWLLNSLQTQQALFRKRQEQGRVREGHGDLHLRNVVLFQDVPTPFDALEFDPALRWIDVISDVAFMMMDLMAHRRFDLAFRFINTYFEDSGDYQGLAVLRFYLVSRALVRFQVMMLAGRQGVADPDAVGAADYLRLAASVIDDTNPRLAIMYGLPGTGKTTVSSRFIEATGAIRVRSDVERKRLFGLKGSDSTARQGKPSVYVAATTERTYARLLEVARTAVHEGFPVVVDAAFLLRKQRAPFARFALDAGVAFSTLACEAPLDILRDRIVKRLRRGDDASEADVEVLEKLRFVAEPPGADEPGLTLPIDSTDPEQIEAAIRSWATAKPPGATQSLNRAER